MTYLTNRHMRKKARHQGLILLIALGMLAMFSLLAVTYMVFAASSLTGSEAMRTKARNSNVTIEGASRSVVNAVIRGTNDQTSAYYKNSLFDDLYGPNPLRSRFGNTLLGSIAFQPDWCRLISPDAPLFSPATASSPRGPNLVKVSLLNSDVVNGPLSDFENEYNSRILTVLEGPLAGQSFRILKYVGQVRGPTDLRADPNIPNLPWSNPTSYQDVDSHRVDYSVLIDLSDVKGTVLTGQLINGAGKAETVTLPLKDWVKDFGVSSLFFLRNGAIYTGYSFLINDAAFNSAGIGMSDVANKPVLPAGIAQGFGTLDSRELMQTAGVKVPPALLPNYDYLAKPDYMATGVTGIGLKTRQTVAENLLNGSSNEGFDVPDWHDLWLSHQSWVSGRPNIIPSGHRPELINYIANLFGNPASMSLANVQDMLRLIDASSARIMRYSVGNLRANPGFRSNVDPNPALLDPAAGGSFTWTGPTDGEIRFLQEYVARQINGPWDVDNDKDGFADSVVVNPGLPVVYSPDGRMLRAVASLLVEDLDSRININTAGDRGQGLPNFNLGTDGRAHKPKLASAPVRQSIGYGPADISLTSLFNPLKPGATSLLATSPTSFSFFDDRYGSRQYKIRPLNFNDVSLDRSPGRRRLAGSFQENDNFSQMFERELHRPFSHARMPGAPSGRRGDIAGEMDRLGNITYLQQLSADADIYNYAVASAPSEINDDPYESQGLEKSTADDPIGLNDLAAILLRFEGDSNALPKRLRDHLDHIAGYNDTHSINRLITTRSAELRYPNLIAAMKTTHSNFPNPVIDAQATSMQRWVQMLHAQRYKNFLVPVPQSFPNGDPDLTIRAIEELFSTDFTKGLRMDLNRPFGNGFDDDTGGAIDEPYEISVTAQTERASDQNGNLVTATGSYSREIQTTMGASSAGTRGRLGSRQIFARNLYCLAQLIVPRDHMFPGMPNLNPTFANAKIRARALAQWAVNVVDFRDADAGMTRFEYDILPFGTKLDAANGFTARPAYWAPDHLDQAVNGIPNKDYTGVVWGMEVPELLLTETYAAHDKRQRDTDLEKAMGELYGPMGDPHFDQYRFPLASLFIELYNPRSTDSITAPSLAGLSATSTVMLPGVPIGLYTIEAGTGQPKLNLGSSPTSTTTWGRQPVWRIAISEYDANHAKDLVENNGNTLAFTTHQVGTTASINGGSWPPPPMSGPDEVTGSGLQYDLVDPMKRPIAFDRFIWFTNFGPDAGKPVPDLKSGLAPANAVYYNRTIATPLLGGGSYAVIGPRTETEIGSATHSRTSPFATWDPILRRSDIVTDPTKKPIFSPSAQKISLAGNTVATKMLNNADANAAWMSRIKSPLSLVCATEPPNASWNAAFPDGIGINVSLPTPDPSNSMWTATRIPTRRLNGTDAAPGYASLPPDSWIDVGPVGSVTGTLPDVPFDEKIGGAIINTEIDKLLDPALTDVSPLGTYDNVRAVYLQRLADPDFAYDPIENPYITVDWMSVDLTIFNGEAPVNSAINPTPKPTKFQSRYKDGRYATNPSAGSGFSYHSPSTPPLAATVPQPDPPLIQHQSYFKHQLGYRTAIGGWAGSLGNSGTTLGYVNAGFLVNPATPLTPAQMAETNGSTVTALMDGFGPPTSQTDASVNVAPPYIGAPRNIVSIAWMNRPFATPGELMLVPFTGPGQFGYYHSAFSGTYRTPFAFTPNFQASNAVNTEEDPLRSFWMNKSTSLNPSAPPTVEQDMHLFFELVETQPPFADANRVAEPNVIAGLITTAVSNNDRVALRFLNSYVPPNYYLGSTRELVRGPGLVPPFNMFPSYVAVGKVNLNTITEDNLGNSGALKAIENNVYPAADRTTATNTAQTASFMAARRGYPTPLNGNSLFFTDPASIPAPLRFNGKVNDIMHAHYPTQFAGAFRPASSANIAPYVENAVARQKLRGKFGVETTLARSLDPNTPLVPDPYALTLNKTAMDMYNSQPLQFSTGESDAYTHSQRAMRLPNLVTNQSNVFAVWVTVSLYEYDPVLGFGNEYVDDRGEPKRERSFYIIDRSIPVGFKPGENLNTDRTILLQRTLD